MSDTSETNSIPEGVAALLALQDVDIAIDQLQHRRGHLPQAKQITELVTAREQAIAAAAAGEIERDALLARQGHLEDEITETTARIATIEKQLTSGSAASFRDQAAMGGEITSLQTRRTELEDNELAIMEELEPLHASHDILAATLAQIADDVATLKVEVADAQAAIDEELKVKATERAVFVPNVGDVLLAEYERIRPRLDGVGAARLVHGTCSGCHLKLSASELDALHKLPHGTLSHCEQCGRILVEV